jgi:hypothetical protein
MVRSRFFPILGQSCHGSNKGDSSKNPTKMICTTNRASKVDKFQATSVAGSHRKVALKSNEYFGLLQLIG